jgi:hypothetical protein
VERSDFDVDREESVELWPRQTQCVVFMQLNCPRAATPRGDNYHTGCELCVIELGALSTS